MSFHSCDSGLAAPLAAEGIVVSAVVVADVVADVVINGMVVICWMTSVVVSCTVADELVACLRYSARTLLLEGMVVFCPTLIRTMPIEPSGANTYSCALAVMVRLADVVSDEAPTSCTLKPLHVVVPLISKVMLPHDGELCCTVVGLVVVGLVVVVIVIDVAAVVLPDPE